MSGSRHPLRSFPAPLPQPERALAYLYDVFSDQPPPVGPFCADCFSLEAERRILSLNPIRDAPPDEISPIFSEHIECSVGVDGFFHIFPRVLETLFFDEMIYPDVTAIALYCGLTELPASHQEAVVDAAACAMVGFFEGGSTDPFCDPFYSHGGGHRLGRADAGLRLVHLLLALRVEPRQIFERMVATNSPTTWDMFARALTRPAWLRVAWAGNSLGPIEAQIDAIAWADFFAVVGQRTFAKGAGKLDPSGPKSMRQGAAHANYHARLAAMERKPRAQRMKQLARALKG